MRIPIWQGLTIGLKVIRVINKYIRYKKPLSDAGVDLSDNEKKNLFADISELIMNILKGKRSK